MEEYKFCEKVELVKCEWKNIRVCLVIGFKHSFLFSVFESKKWWAQVKKNLFGNLSQFLHSKIFIVHLILNWPKMRTPFTCFRLVLVTVQKTSDNFAIFCTN
jgi:hypothetical protein